MAKEDTCHCQVPLLHMLCAHLQLHFMFCRAVIVWKITSAENTSEFLSPNQSLNETGRYCSGLSTYMSSKNMKWFALIDYSFWDSIHLDFSGFNGCTSTFRLTAWIWKLLNFSTQNLFGQKDFVLTNTTKLLYKGWDNLLPSASSLSLHALNSKHSTYPSKDNGNVQLPKARSVAKYLCELRSLKAQTCTEQCKKRVMCIWK